MESLVAPAEKFVSLDDDEAYAGTSILEWQLITEQMANFIPLKMEDLGPETQDCEICYEPLGRSENPVKLAGCGHIFGDACLYRWVAGHMPRGKWCNWGDQQTLWPHASEEAFQSADELAFYNVIIEMTIPDISKAFQSDGELRPDWRYVLNCNSEDIEDLQPRTILDPLNNQFTQYPDFIGARGSYQKCKASCPKCRSQFRVLRSGFMGVRIEARLLFWDRVYEKLGLSRSAKEEEFRADLLRYVQMLQVSRTETEISTQHMRPFTLQAQVSAMRFALRRGTRDLDPLQTFLRDGIFNLACYGLHDGEYNASSYEDRKVPTWCYQVDRIERGMTPIIIAFMQPLFVLDRVLNDPEYRAMAQPTMEFYQSLLRQRSGPWRRSLFAEVGGDRDGLRWKNPDDQVDFFDHVDEETDDSSDSA